MKNKVKEFREFLLEKGIKIGTSVDEREIVPFEEKYEIKFPIVFKDFFLEINGMPDYEMDGLAHLYTFNEIHRAIDFLYPAILPVREIINGKKIYPDLNHSLSEGEYPLYAKGKELSEAIELKILLTQPDQYFIFGDYNIGGGYWAINLNHRSKLYNSIIIIYKHVSSYVLITDSFEKFLDEYINDCPEALLWTL